MQVVEFANDSTSASCSQELYIIGSRNCLTKAKTSSTNSRSVKSSRDNQLYTGFSLYHKGASKKKLLACLASGFWLLRGWHGGGEGLSESVKKGKFVTKIF